MAPATRHHSGPGAEKDDNVLEELLSKLQSAYSMIQSEHRTILEVYLHVGQDKVDADNLKSSAYWWMDPSAIAHHCELVHDYRQALEHLNRHMTARDVRRSPPSTMTTAAPQRSRETSLDAVTETLALLGTDEEAVESTHQGEAKLLRLDSRITLPTQAGISKLSLAGIVILGAMRSPMALSQVCQLLDKPGMVQALAPVRGSPDVVDDVVQICKRIEEWEKGTSQSNAYTFAFRVMLYLAIEAKRSSEGKRMPKGLIKNIATRSECPRKKVWNYYSSGKKMAMLCGGHEGLLAFFPLASTNDFGIAPIKFVQQLGLPEAKKVGQLMRDDWARAMCCLGKEALGNMTWSGESPEAPTLRERLDTSMNFATATRAQVDDMLEPWKGKKCNCHWKAIESELTNTEEEEQKGGEDDEQGDETQDLEMGGDI